MGLFSRNRASSVCSICATSRRAALEFGLPSPCPQCGGHGYLEGIDVKRRIMFQHCTVCSVKWETSEADLAAR